MLDPNLPELKVLDYTQALQRSQSLESRGDFLNKGIYKLLITIYEWTEKFTVNKILPNQDQLERDLSYEPEKLEYFLSEYAIRTRPPLIKKLNYLDYAPTEGSGDTDDPRAYLRHSSVFCRPTSADGTTCYRYVTGLNEISIDAIRRWINERRQSTSPEKMRQNINRAIEENRLYDTYASTEIGGLFNCIFDTTKQLKDSTIVLHLKPILKKLVEDRLLFFIRNDKASKAGNKSLFFYFKKEEIFTRLEIYIDYMRDVIVKDLVRIGVLEEPSAEEYENIKPTAENILRFLSDSYGDQKTVVEEIILLADYYNHEKEKEFKEQKRKVFEDVMVYIQSSGKLIDMNFLRVQSEFLDEESRNSILSNPSILYAEYADRLSYHEYILHKDGIPQAIQNAKNIFLSTGNDAELTVLRLMDVHSHVDDSALIRNLEEIENRALFRHLSFFTWLWRSLVGNKVVHRFEADAIRNKLNRKLKALINEQRTKFLAKEKTRIAEERIKKDKPSSEKSGDGSLQSQRLELLEEEGSSPSILTEKRADSEEDPKLKAKLEKILSAMDEAWDFGYYPDRNYLMDKLEGSMEEDELISFMKKKGGKDIYSYQVRDQIEKYPFPILVSKQYLKKNGKRLLEKAIGIIEEQKAESMPNQEKFDLAVSLADFLERILPKLK
ncbi:hypothetical protein [Leptospira sp. GIMC2001]|uniref:hypothetical protein n=1 Tax=Leptospira sp. GIMC2001 TaxID=1513297 RepID=UPI00234A1B3D|nr:hypothetical protein [Leptospira sp. GIMC2001]WCL47666.1 hypothetical protein O4O04_01475 [Leptospira sp. GIMC2001]